MTLSVFFFFQCLYDFSKRTFNFYRFTDGKCAQICITAESLCMTEHTSVASTHRGPAVDLWDVWVLIVSSAWALNLIGLLGGFKFPLMTDEQMTHQWACPEEEANANRWLQSPANDESDLPHKWLRSVRYDGNLTMPGSLTSLKAKYA